MQLLLMHNLGVMMARTKSRMVMIPLSMMILLTLLLVMYLAATMVMAMITSNFVFSIEKHYSQPMTTVFFLLF